MAERQRTVLQKSRSRDVRAADYGGYMLVDGDTNAVILGGDPFAYSATLDEIEGWLLRPLPGEKKGG